MRSGYRPGEGDFATARRELRARKHPNYNAACFHAQQCAEKYLKARLLMAGTRFPKTHDLEALVKLLLPHEPGLLELLPMAVSLTSLAVDVRYPGHPVDKATAAEALGYCNVIRAAVRRSLGLND
ncbi:MAG TPA: HEPN domain-containing protein [Candidatus Latescibacteria bacterium]|nr:HEPN domain-containing protein [Candidatus Latescibacterota bacterium]HOS65934.1 HEPN domain-containing protein [Candidatus Latescibacterota bacterium]HPK75371.1 HEPN domain-containing protein [Candidatus Latescibacterota bacterium]